MFTIVGTLGAHGVWTLNFVELRNNARCSAAAAATAACFLLFIGATGKSAQIPLYVWLPDAMVGPTPVSALIHAATMVTAGVYMIARLGFMFTMAPSALDLVATIGAVTALFAATIAIVQPDIKKVLAYSTISQLGYMFLGVGSGAFASGIFHVMTHAFFKGLLFLCAGSVMHALGGEQDMNKMGGLRRKLPITFSTMFIATLAIAAVPPFSGYFSKDLILEVRLRLGTLVALVQRRGHRRTHVVLHVPADLHDVLRRVARRLRQRASHPRIAGGNDYSADRTGYSRDGWRMGKSSRRIAVGQCVRAIPRAGGRHVPSPALKRAPTTLSLCRQLASGLGILLAYMFYIRLPGIPFLLAWRLKPAYELLLNKYYIDELYNFIVTRPLFWISNNVLNRAIDSFVIDGAAKGAGSGGRDLGPGGAPR